MLLFYSGWFCEGRRRRLQAEKRPRKPHLEESNKDTGVWWRERLAGSAGKCSPRLSPGRDVDKYFHNHRKKKRKKEACWLPGREPRCSRQHVWALSRKGQRLLLKRGFFKKKATLPFPVAFSTTGCRDELLSSPHSHDKIGSEGQTSKSDASRSPGSAWMWGYAFIWRRLCAF